MRKKTQYTEAFRQQALEKVYTRGSRTVIAVADELNMNPYTLKNWMKSHKETTPSSDGIAGKRPHDWSPAERLEVLLDSHGLDEAALSIFCREKGIFPHHLQQWRAAFEGGPSSASKVNPAALRDLKETNKTLARELRRKDKALAEAAALLVLQKKYQALWEEVDE